MPHTASLLSPTPVTSRLQMLGERLREAVGARNWSALARTDAELGQLLTALRGASLSPGERGALRQLARLHQQVRTECETELERVRDTLSRMQDQRGGWMAYAESAAWGGAETQA